MSEEKQNIKFTKEVDCIDITQYEISNFIHIENMKIEDGHLNLRQLPFKLWSLKLIKEDNDLNNYREIGVFDLKIQHKDGLKCNITISFNDTNLSWISDQYCPCPILFPYSLVFVDTSIKASLINGERIADRDLRFTYSTGLIDNDIFRMYSIELLNIIRTIPICSNMNNRYTNIIQRYGCCGFNFIDYEQYGNEVLKQEITTTPKSECVLLEHICSVRLMGYGVEKLSRDYIPKKFMDHRDCGLNSVTIMTAPPQRYITILREYLDDFIEFIDNEEDISIVKATEIYKTLDPTEKAINEAKEELEIKYEYYLEFIKRPYFSTHKKKYEYILRDIKKYKHNKKFKIVMNDLLFRPNCSGYFETAKHFKNLI